MAKASLKLPNGTEVTVEGTTEEVRQLLAFYGHAKAQPAGGGKDTRAKVRRTEEHGAPEPAAAETAIDLAKIVSLVKTCEDAEAIETQILDRTNQVDRTLLPLYVVHEHMGNPYGLTSGEISKITTDLGIPISQPNTSRALSGTASRYVIGDKVRKKGQAVRYRLSRRGVQYLKSVLKGSGNGEQK